MIDMQVKHWNYGEGVVIREAYTREDAPLEWQHDWESVVLVEFIDGDDSNRLRRLDREWVLRDDLTVIV